MVVFQVSRKGKETAPQQLDAAAFLPLSPWTLLKDSWSETHDQQTGLQSIQSDLSPIRQ
jgi:hypothetical protein